MTLRRRARGCRRSPSFAAFCCLFVVRQIFYHLDGNVDGKADKGEEADDDDQVGCAQTLAADLVEVGLLARL